MIDKKVMNNKFRQMFDNKQHKTMRTLSYVLLITFITVACITFYGSIALKQNENVQHLATLTIPPLSPTVEATPTQPFPTKVIPTPEPKRLIKRVSSEGAKVVFIFDKYEPNIIRWQNYLFYGYYHDPNKAYGALTIYRHNIKTGETQEIITRTNESLAVGQLTLIENTLFFTFVGYMAEGETYWIDLDSEHIPHKLAYNDSGIVTQIKGRYYFIVSEGDSCWGKADYFLIDLNTKKLTPVAFTYTGCGGGDEYLGINNNDQMILANHIGATKYNYGWPPPNLYSSILFIPLSSPTDRKYIISPQTMPSDILLVKYSDKRDELLLVGDAVYIYSFSRDRLEKIIEFPKNWIEYKKNISFLGWSDTIVCISKPGSDIKKSIEFMIDLETRTLSNDVSQCPSDEERQERSTMKEQLEQKSKQVFQDLNLPSNYVLVKE